MQAYRAAHESSMVGLMAMGLGYASVDDVEEWLTIWNVDALLIEELSEDETGPSQLA